MAGTALSRVRPVLTVRPCRGRYASPAPPLSCGRPGTLTFLVSHGGQASRGDRVELCERGGEAAGARSARGLYCFLLPLSEGRLAHLRANTGQSERAERRGGRGSRVRSLSRRAESLAAGSKRALLPCPDKARSRLPSIARARGW